MGAIMKNKVLTVRRVKAADVYKDIVRIDINVRGFEFQESRIYKLKCNGETSLVSVRGLSDEKNRSDNDICMDEKTRFKFGIENDKPYSFTLERPRIPLLPLVVWSLRSSDPLQRMAAIWAIVSLGFGVLGLFGLTVPQMMTYYQNALTYLPKGH